MMVWHDSRDGQQVLMLNVDYDAKLYIRDVCQDMQGIEKRQPYQGKDRSSDGLYPHGKNREYTRVKKNLSHTKVCSWNLKN